MRRRHRAWRGRCRRRDGGRWLTLPGGLDDSAADGEAFAEADAIGVGLALGPGRLAEDAEQVAEYEDGDHRYASGGEQNRALADARSGSARQVPPGGLGLQDQPGPPEGDVGCHPRQAARRRQPGGASRREPLAASVRLGEAELHLSGALERRGRRKGMAAVLGIEPVRHRAAVVGQGQVGTDPLHVARIAAWGGAAEGAHRGALKNELSRRRPIFPGGCPPSIFGAGELNFRVRDGNGWFLSASVTGIDLQLARPTIKLMASEPWIGSVDRRGAGQCRRPNAVQQRARRVN